MSRPCSVYFRNLINSVWRLSMDLWEIETLIRKKKIVKIKINLTGIVRFSRCFFPSGLNIPAMLNTHSQTSGTF